MLPKKISGKASAMRRTRKATTKVTSWPMKGVESIQGRGFVKLASWIVERHDKYGSFIKRVQKFIAGVLIAEKEKESKGQARKQSCVRV